MKLFRFDGELSTLATLFLKVSVTFIALASFFGAAGAVMGNLLLLKLHPYLFFVGFGNLAILLLNRYLTAAIYPELKIDPSRQLSRAGGDNGSVQVELGLGGDRAAVVYRPVDLCRRDLLRTSRI